MSKTKKQLIALVGTIILAIFLVITIKNILDSQNDRFPIYVYTQDVKENTKITKDMITAITMEKETLMQPKMYLADNYVNSPNLVLGKITTRTMYVGEPVLLKGLDDWVNDSTAIETGDSRKRAFTLKVDSLQLFAGDVKAGDKIDILESGTGSGEGSFIYSIPVLQNVTIQELYTSSFLKYESKIDLTTNSTSSTSAGEDTQIGAMTVYLTLEEINKLNTTMLRGQLVYAKYLGSSEEYSALGYVIGNYSKEFNGTANPRVNIIENNSESEELDTYSNEENTETLKNDTIIEIQR